MAEQGKPPDERADRNREQKLKANRLLNQLLALACAPDFDGTVSIAVSAKGGRLGKVRQHWDAYDPDDSKPNS